RMTTPPPLLPERCTVSLGGPAHEAPPALPIPCCRPVGGARMTAQGSDGSFPLTAPPTAPTTTVPDRSRPPPPWLARPPPPPRRAAPVFAGAPPSLGPPSMPAE